MKKILTLGVMTLIGFSSISVQAHGLWAGMRADKLQVVYGEGPLDNFYNPKWFAAAKGYDDKHNAQKVKVINDENRLFLEPKESIQVVTLLSNNGYWSNTKHSGWVNKAKDENPEATKGKFHTKMSVNYLSQNILFKKSAPKKIKTPKAYGLKIEIVPSVDPRFLHAGDNLKVQVLFNGKPMKGVNVMFDAINHLGEGVKTDEKGYATVKVSNNGFNMVAVETSFPRKDKTKADADGYFSSLNFTLSPNH